MTVTPTVDHAGLLDALTRERRVLLDIYRLARRQRRHMIHRRVEEMAGVVEQIDRLLPEAQEQGRRREALLEGIVRDGGSGLQEWVASVDTPWRERLHRALRELARVSGRLQSLNFQNFQLARYSFDLTQEEVRILVGESGEDRLYESDGDADAKDRRGVVDGRA